MSGKCLSLFAGLMVIAGVITGCTRGVHGGDPTLPLSTTNGTVLVFPVSESTALVAISNAFATSDTNPMGYRGMHLYPAAEESYLIPNWYPTNGSVLRPIAGPIANVPLRGDDQVFVPYTAFFYITTKAVDSSSTSVSVRTIISTVKDGKEFGIHGGWASHQRIVPPVQVEEENVLNAVSNAVVMLKLKEVTKDTIRSIEK